MGNTLLDATVAVAGGAHQAAKEVDLLQSL